MKSTIFKKTGVFHFDLAIVAITGSLYALPIIGDLVIYGWQRAFSFFAADAFYYLTVARNYALTGIFTFDGIFPTNGFHPLWQVMLGVLYKVGLIFSIPDSAILVIVLFLSLILILGGLICIGQAFKLANGSIPVWLLLLPTGIYALLLAPFEPRFGSLWSFTNAMETAPLIFFFGLLMWLWSRPGFMQTQKSAVTTGLTLSLIILSRLDHIFLVIAFFVFMIIQWIVKRGSAKLFSTLVLAGIIPAIIVGSYIFANVITTGMTLPVSGSIKTTFPDIAAGTAKFKELVTVLSNYKQPDFGASLWRYSQILLPAFFSIAVVIKLLFRKIFTQGTSLDQFWLVTGGMVILLSTYNFLFVPTLDQGHWYYPISILFMTLVFVNWLPDNAKNRVRGMSLAVLMTISLLFYYGVYHNASRNQRFADFYNHQSVVQTYYEVPPKIIEYDDGIISYATGFPALSGFGFVLDKEAAEALKLGQLLDLAYDRGYRHIASYYYFGSKFNRYATPQEIKQQFSDMAFFIGQYSLEEYSFRLDYLSPEGNFVIIEFEKAIY